MGKKGKDDPVADEAPRPEDEEEPAEPEILKLCFRTGSQLYYGECKAGFKQRYGTFVRHGFGKLVDAAVSPVGIRPELGQELAYETVVLATYDGRWQDNVLTGPGTVKWSDGSAYEGAFADGQLHGHGRFVWPDGSAYEGAWHQGAMHGQGRFDSRFDGSFLQGRFHQNQLLQAKDGTWVDILEEHRRLEQDSILHAGDGSSVQVRVCGLHGCSPGQGQTLLEVSAPLEAAFAEAQAAGLVPFVLADESCEESVLKCFRLSGSHPDRCVSLREASVARRRKRDFNRLFYDAIQASLRSGSRFVMVLEDDDGGIDATDVEGWSARTSSRGAPSNVVPEEWKIPSFFDPDAFPIDVFRPQSFNGRNLAKLFLPEEVKNEQDRALRLLSPGPEAPRPDTGERPKTEETAPPKAKAKAEAKGRNSTIPSTDPAGDLEARLKVRRRIFQLGSPTSATKRMRLLEVACVVVFTMFICLWPAVIVGCEEAHAGDAEAHRRLGGGASEGPPDVTGGICQPGEFSTMGFILLSPKEAAIKTLFSREMAAGAKLSAGSLLASFVIVWGTTIVTFGSAMPVGLFIPNILAGACLGRSVGQQLVDSGLSVKPDVYALMGAAGALAGFSRMTISLAVIFLEITNNMYMLLPLMLVIMASKQVADLFGPSVYDIVLESNPEVHLLEDGLSEDHLLVLEGLTVHDVASTEVIVLRSFEPLEKVMQLLLQTSFSAYPVVDADGRLVGIVNRTKLLLLVEQKTELVGTGELIPVVSLADTAPEVTHCNTPVMRAYRHFRASGLQHMSVVDHKHTLQGLLTRTDFAALCRPGSHGVEAVRNIIHRKEAAASAGQVVVSGKQAGQDRVCVFAPDSDAESTPTASHYADDLYDEMSNRSSSTPRRAAASQASPTGRSLGGVAPPCGERPPRAAPLGQRHARDEP